MQMYPNQINYFYRNHIGFRKHRFHIVDLCLFLYGLSIYVFQFLEVLLIFCTSKHFTAATPLFIQVFKFFDIGFGKFLRNQSF
jgi:hypothetical protein